MSDDTIVLFPGCSKENIGSSEPTPIADLPSESGITYNIIDSVSFMPGGPNHQIQIVLVHTKHSDTVTAYIGTGGNKQTVAGWGCKLSKAQAESFFGSLPNYRAVW